MCLFRHCCELRHQPCCACWTLFRQSTERWSHWRATVTLWVWLCSSSSGCSGTQTSPLSTDTPKCLTFTKTVISERRLLCCLNCYSQGQKNKIKIIMISNFLRWKVSLEAACSLSESKVIKRDIRVCYKLRLCFPLEKHKPLVPYHNQAEIQTITMQIKT